jgi:HSP20 family protein
MLIRTDPFRELDRMAAQVFGTRSRPAAMPMDAWREGDRFVIEFDLPAVNPEQVDLDVDRNVLTVRAERVSPTSPDVELIASERPRGVFSRQVILGDSLDVANIEASYQAGVLRLSIPVAERAKPRKISINANEQSGSIATGSRDSGSASTESQASVASAAGGGGGGNTNSDNNEQQGISA